VLKVGHIFALRDCQGLNVTEAQTPLKFYTRHKKLGSPALPPQARP